MIAPIVALICLNRGKVVIPRPGPSKTLAQIDANDPDISPARLKFITAHLAAFVNRNTSTDHLERAAQWVYEQYKTIPGLKVRLFSYTVHKGPRIPATKKVDEVVAVLPGRDDQRVLMGGHLDSINMYVPADIQTLETARAPGADDDLSGMASTMEVARVMARKHWQHTCVFIAFSGEEQGLFGSHALANYAKDHQWKILGFLNNDIIGSGHDEIGQRNDHMVRLFSPSDPFGHGSRSLAQYIQWINVCHNSNGSPYFSVLDKLRPDNPKFQVQLEFRLDRYLRGGDHYSFIRAGYPAVRFTEPYESFTHQHSPYDLPQYVDFNYEAKVAEVNLLGVSSLAQAQAPPTDVRIKLNLSHSTNLSWKGDPSQTYVVYWRTTTSPVWQHAVCVTGLHARIGRVSKDDNIFAVGAEGGVPVLAR